MFMFESSKEEGSQVKLMFSVEIRNVFIYFSPQHFTYLRKHAGKSQDP